MKLQHRVFLMFIAVAGASVAVTMQFGRQASSLTSEWAFAAAGGLALGGGLLTWLWLTQALNSVRDCIKGEPNARPMAGVEALVTSLSEWRNTATAQLEREQGQWRDASDLVVRLTPLSGRGNLSADTPPGLQLRNHLSKMATTARTEIQRILDLTDDIARRTKDTTASTTQQQQAVTETATAVESVSQNIDAVTQTADAATDSGTEALETAQQAHTIVKNLIGGMDSIRLHVEAAEKKLMALGERSQEIGSIVETISAISDRTDLLALNASIESVRAGENGRGFAIVADEVRKLAEQTAGAAREVAALIDSMQSETQESIATMVQERAQVDQEVRRVNEAGDALDAIGRSLAQSAQLVTSISDTATGQLEGAAAIVQGMQSVTEAADGIRGQAEEVRQTTMALAAAARDLDDSIAPLYGCADSAVTTRVAPRPAEATGQPGEEVLRDLAMEVIQ